MFFFFAFSRHSFQSVLNILFHFHNLIIHPAISTIISRSNYQDDKQVMSSARELATFPLGPGERAKLLRAGKVFCSSLVSRDLIFTFYGRIHIRK